jgi:colanic acid/amylovoran biosynthesis glycosyltransferase
MKNFVLHVRHHCAAEPFIEDIITGTEAFEPVVLFNDWNPYAPEPTGYRFHLLVQSPAPWRWGWTISGAWIGLTGHLPQHRTLDYPRVAVLHAHFGPTGVWALPLRRRLGVPLVTSFYGYDVSQHAGRLLWRLLYRVLFRQGDCFLVLGPAMRRRLVALGCPPEKIRVHRLGVDVCQIPFRARQAPLEEGHLRVLMVGRLVEKKGFRYGVQAFACLAERFPQAELRIAGDGPEQHALGHQISCLGLDSRVRFLGHVPRDTVLEEMARAHLLLAPSITATNGDQEGTPTVLLEAQATGLPVITTWHADIPSTVLNGESGYVVPERDVALLSQRLLELANHPDRWAEMGMTGRKHIEDRFDIQELSRALDQLYQGLIVMPVHTGNDRIL